MTSQWVLLRIARGGQREARLLMREGAFNLKVVANGNVDDDPERGSAVRIDGLGGDQLVAVAAETIAEEGDDLDGLSACAGAAAGDADGEEERGVSMSSHRAILTRLARRATNCRRAKVSPMPQRRERPERRRQGDAPDGC